MKLKKIFKKICDLSEDCADRVALRLIESELGQCIINIFPYYRKIAVDTIFNYCKGSDVEMYVYNDSMSRPAMAPRKTIEDLENISCIEYVQKKAFAEYTVVLKHVFLGGSSEYVIYQDKFLSDDFYMAPNRVIRNYSKSFLLKVTENYAILKRKKIHKIKRGICLNKRWTYNYFHFTFESMARLYLVDEFLKDKRFSDYPLLVDKEAMLVDQNRELLGYINTTGREIIVLNERKLYEVDELVFPSLMSWGVPDQSELKYKYAWRMDDNAAKYIRKKVFDAVKPRINNNSPSKIYIARGDTNRLINEPELIERLKKDWEIYYPTEHSVKEQVETFYNAKKILGVSGTGFVNLIYCQKNVKAFVIAPMEFQHDCMTGIGDSVGIAINFIAAEMEHKGSTLNQSTFAVSVDKVVRMVND